MEKGANAFGSHLEQRCVHAHASFTQKGKKREATAVALKQQQ